MSIEQTAPDQSAPESTQQQSTQQQTPISQPPAEKPKVDIGRAFSAMSRKDKELREREKQIEERTKKFKEGEDKYEGFIKKFRTNPLEAIQEAGLDYDDLTQTALNGGKLPENIQLRTKLAELEARLAKYEKPEEEPNPEEAQRQEFEKAEQEFIEGVETFVTDNSEKYPLVLEHDAAQAVYHVMQGLYRQNVEQGKQDPIPSHDEAAELVEQHLQQKLDELAQKRGYVRKPADAQGQAPTSQRSSATPQAPTLSNQLTTSRPADAKSGLLPKEEALRRAAELIRSK